MSREKYLVELTGILMENEGFRILVECITLLVKSIRILIFNVR